MKTFTNQHNYRLSLNQAASHVGEEEEDGDVAVEDGEDVDVDVEEDGDGDVLVGDMEDADAVESSDFIYFKP